MSDAIKQAIEVQPIPKGYVKASEAVDARTIHAQLHDIWNELNALDTIFGDQHRLMAKVAKLRDACGAAVNCSIPIAFPVEPSQAQPSDTAITYMTGYSDAKDWAATLPGAQTCSP